MKIRFGIRFKFFIFILSLLLVIGVALFYLLRQVRQRDELLKTIASDHQPSVSAIEKLRYHYEKLNSLAFHRLIVQPGIDSIFKAEYNQLLTFDIQENINLLIVLSDSWTDADAEVLKSSYGLIRDSLISAWTELEDELLYEGYSRPFNAPVLNERTESSELFFIRSEIEQNLDYLRDKKATEIEVVQTQVDLNSKKLKGRVITLILIFTILLLTFALFTLHYLKRNLALLNSALNNLSQGRIPGKLPEPLESEFTLTFINLNQLSSYVRNLAELSGKILRKDFSSVLTPPEPGDELGNALLNLHNDLQHATQEEEKRRREDEQRKWVSEGIAGINEILRKSGDRIEDLAYEIIRELVRYTGARVGGMFTIAEAKGKQYAELLSVYAYDRKKYLEKKINEGEGLIGRCMIEMETIHITEVPKGYLKVKSGLGENDPLCLLVVPLKIGNKLYGVIELAGFTDFEPYKISFLETIGESVATTLSKLKISLQTAQLLEHTRQQKEEMATQEEEMRMNMEELKATQELSMAREEQLKKEIENLTRRLQS
jgi:hypothetical protein